MAGGQLSGGLIGGTYRIIGGNGPDTEGLLAVVLIVTVIYGVVPRWPSARAALLGSGCSRSSCRGRWRR